MEWGSEEKIRMEDVLELSEVGSVPPLLPPFLRSPFHCVSGLVNIFTGSVLSRVHYSSHLWRSILDLYD